MLLGRQKLLILPRLWTFQGKSDWELQRCYSLHGGQWALVGKQKKGSYWQKRGNASLLTLASPLWSYLQIWATSQQLHGLQMAFVSCWAAMMVVSMFKTLLAARASRLKCCPRWEPLQWHAKKLADQWSSMSANCWCLTLYKTDLVSANYMICIQIAFIQAITLTIIYRRTVLSAQYQVFVLLKRIHRNETGIAHL